MDFYLPGRLTMPSTIFQKTFRSSVYVLLCAAAGIQCVSLAAASAAAPALETIAGRRVEAVTIKRPDARATVVFENGSRATVDAWRKVIDMLPQDVSVFAYNRPGYGSSETTVTPRDGATIAAELRGVLQQQGLQPPYVLVGHSLGGLYMQLFARRYPEDVRGLVLVDAVYPGVIKKPEDFPLLTRGAKRLFFSRTVNDEIDAIYRTGEQVLALPAQGGQPMIQLINRPKGATAVPVDFGVVNADSKTAAAVKAMYPQATRIVLDSDHQMQNQHAAEVAGAIGTILAGHQAGSQY
jgi:pimeloyl-ACP methyl ester carboxylesterase